MEGRTDMSNPDEPEKCPYLMADGIHCFEKSCQHSYDQEVIDGKESWLVKCPFVRQRESAEGCNDQA